jgi:hypothetical protein
MTKLPAWRVDPAWPAVPPDDSVEPDPREPGPEELGSPHSDPQQVDLIQQERRALANRVAELHVQGLNLQLKLHRAQRALQARPAAPAPPAQARPRNVGGRPRQLARNDRLLALYDTTPAHLPHLQRCRQAAHLLAAEIAASAGLPPERARVMADTTARDAIAEAQSRRGSP